MKTSYAFWVSAGVAISAGLSGCGKSDSTAPASADNSTPAPAAFSAPATPAAPGVSVTFKIPDFQKASVAELYPVAVQALNGLGQAAADIAPAITEKVQAVKTALATGNANDALSSLANLNTASKGVDGLEGLSATATQLVSAWALKQGFDVAKISGVLGALQKQDYAALASQAASVFAKGGITGEQQSLLEGVLNVYGIDSSKAAGAVGAVKGLFGK